jgi:hypothetical protein
MARASERRKSTKISPSSEFLNLTRNTDLPVHTRFERVKKEPGSYELINGVLVEVK